MLNWEKLAKERGEEIVSIKAKLQSLAHDRTDQNRVTPGSEMWTCRMCNGHGGHYEGCTGESDHLKLLSELKSALAEYPKIPNDVWIGSNSDTDKVRWLAGRCNGSDRTITHLHNENLRLLTLLKSVHEWFMEKSPDNYNGCGLWIDVDLTLQEAAGIIRSSTPTPNP